VAKITKRSADYSRWYTDIVQRAQLADYAPVKGCMVIKPHGYAIWEKMQAALDGMFKETGHSNAYFPLFIPESFLKKEAEHVEGFAPECAVVTHGGGKKLEESLYVRPTSETIIWSMYKKWIQSYRDLPLLYNQWCNVVRWEMRTRLFLRTTEFLWQEGHTAHATQEEAIEETMQMLEVYRRFAEDWMAVSVVPGEKTPQERFAGAVQTFSIEAMMQDKKALQAGTSHFLGQNFAKAFDVTYQTPDGQLDHVYATSWGVSTRLIGALIMSHSDDQGLVLPPKLAPIQVAIVPIWKTDEERSKVLEAANRVNDQIKADFAVKLDDRDTQSAGWKFNEYELMGVPVRIEIGPRDVEKESVVVVRRDNREKAFVPQTGVHEQVKTILDDLQKSLLEKSKQFREENTNPIDTYDDFKARIEEGFLDCHWCEGDGCETAIAEETKATIRCVPLARELDQGECLYCGKSSPGRVLFAKAY